MKRTSAIKLWRYRTKLRMVEAFGSKCGICGYSKCIKALEFHHLDPSKKDFSPGAGRASSKSWEKICIELRKCVMLCANCHREVHANILKIPKKTPKFNEKYFDYRATLKQDELDDCPVCNGKKLKYRKTCSLSCASQYRFRVDWDSVDLKKLKQQGMTNIAIGDLLGVSDVAVRKRLIKLGLFEKFKYQHQNSKIIHKKKSS